MIKPASTKADLYKHIYNNLAFCQYGKLNQMRARALLKNLVTINPDGYY